MNDFETDMFYDKIIQTLFMNIVCETERCKGNVLCDFHEERPSHRLYFEAAIIANALNKRIIYLDMPRWKYLKFRLENWKLRKIYRRYNGSAAETMENKPTKVSTILDHVADYYEIDNSVYGDILNKFYKKQEDANESDNN